MPMKLRFCTFAFWIFAVLPLISKSEPLLAGRSKPMDIFKDKAQIAVLDALARANYEEADNALVNLPVDKRGTGGETLLWWQVNVGDLAAFEYLLKKGANPTNQVAGAPNVIELCAMQENRRFIELAIEAGANVNMISYFDRQTPIFSAILSRRIKNVEFLLDSGAYMDIADAMGTTPVLLASDQGAFDIVVLLLRRGANPLWKNTQKHDLSSSLAQARLREGDVDYQDLLTARNLILKMNPQANQSRAKDVIP